MDIYFTSDLHLFHKNIIKYENRPFSSIEEMNEVLIDNYNKIINQKDHVYILGDLAFHYGNMEILNLTLKRLKGRKHLIIGNHDLYVRKSSFDKSIFNLIEYYYELKAGGKKYMLMHYPMLSWNASYHGTLHFFGHVHSRPLQYQPDNSYNVGVDVNNFKPISLEEICNKCLDSSVGRAHGSNGSSPF